MGWSCRYKTNKTLKISAFMPFQLEHKKKCTMQLCFQRSILHQLVNEQPGFSMNTVTQKRNYIGMPNSSEQINFILVEVKAYNQTREQEPRSRKTMVLEILTVNSLSQSCPQPSSFFTAAKTSLLKVALYTWLNPPSPKILLTLNLLVADSSDA